MVNAPPGPATEAKATAPELRKLSSVRLAGDWFCPCARVVPLIIIPAPIFSAGWESYCLETWSFNLWQKDHFYLIGNIADLLFGRQMRNTTANKYDYD